MTGALDDVTVLELANWVAGPSAGAIFADMGANVIKVEPLGGDSMRNRLRQPTLPDDAPRTDFPFHLDNRGKRSIAVDLTDPRGGELVRDLVERADVVVTNLLPGRLERYGLAPDQLLAAKPSLVYALVTGFGSSGPDADKIGFDLTAFFARGGVMSLIGEPDDPPHAFRPGQGDHVTGLALATAVLAALRVRDRTGQGQVVETALMRTAAWTIACDLSVALVDGLHPNRRARNQAISPLMTRYRCADDVWVNLAAFDPNLFDRFCEAIGRPDLAADERFATPYDRFQNAELLIGLLDEEFATQPSDYWAPRLDAAGVIWAKVATMPDVVNDPQAEEMGMWAEIDHPVAGPFRTMTVPFSMSATPPEVRGPGPEVGEHTAEVLRELGVDPARIAELADAGVLGGATEAG